MNSIGNTFICSVVTWSASVFLQVSLHFFPMFGLDGLSNVKYRWCFFALISKHGMLINVNNRHPNPTFNKEKYDKPRDFAEFPLDFRTKPVVFAPSLWLKHPARAEAMPKSGKAKSSLALEVS